MPKGEELEKIAREHGYTPLSQGIRWTSDGAGGLNSAVITGEALYSAHVSEDSANISTPEVSVSRYGVSFGDQSWTILCLPSKGLQINRDLVERIIRASDGQSYQRRLWDYYKEIGPMM